MIANYHTHTWRCHHADGEERSYVESAIRSGFQVLGFSDHAPVPFRNYVSSVRMLPAQLDDYVSTILSLREEYRADIEIRLGFEVEYYPGLFSAQLEMMAPYPIEYFLLGQHFVGDEIGEPYCGHPTDSDELFLRYCSQCAEALETGKFSYFAHPDLICYHADPALYASSMRKLCEKAKACGVPLEINLHGIEENRHYPSPQFWRIAGEVGNDVVLGSDAHHENAIWLPDALRTAQSIIEKNHLHLLEKVDLRKPV